MVTAPSSYAGAQPLSPSRATAIAPANLDKSDADYANLTLGQLNEARGQIDTARAFFSSVTKRSEYAAQKAAEALKRFPAK